MLHTSHETLMRRADELGVSLAISHDEAVDTRALRRSDGLVDPLLERLKRAHGDRK
jgi:glycerol-3-phosphate cytidylyltransferase-like family protein